MTGKGKASDARNSNKQQNTLDSKVCSCPLSLCSIADFVRQSPAPPMHRVPYLPTQMLQVQWTLAWEMLHILAL